MLMAKQDRFQPTMDAEGFLLYTNKRLLCQESYHQLLRFANVLGLLEREMYVPCSSKGMQEGHTGALWPRQHPDNKPRQLVMEDPPLKVVPSPAGCTYNQPRGTLSTITTLRPQ